MNSLIEKMHYNCNALLFQLVIQKILFGITLCFRKTSLHANFIRKTDTALGTGTKTNQLAVLDLICLFCIEIKTLDGPPESFAFERKNGSPTIEGSWDRKSHR